MDDQLAFSRVLRLSVFRWRKWQRYLPYLRIKTIGTNVIIKSTITLPDRCNNVLISRCTVTLFTLFTFCGNLPVGVILPVWVIYPSTGGSTCHSSHVSNVCIKLLYFRLLSRTESRLMRRNLSNYNYDEYYRHSFITFFNFPKKLQYLL